MADQNLTGLNNLSAASAVDADELYIFDASETGSARSKAITVAELKLLATDGIESGATADQTGAEIKSAYEGESNTNAFTDSEKSKLSGIETGATADQDLSSYQLQPSEGAFANGDKTKLDAIEAGATADQTGAEIKIAYELEANTNAFTDANVTTLGNQSGTNTGDQTNITGNAATVTTNANLTGHITSTGNAAILGSFTAAQLSTALSDASISGTNTGDQTLPTDFDPAGTDNSTNVTLAGTGTYLSIAGQAITVDPITESDISDLGTYSTATGVADNADVTNTSSVTAAGALMDSEVTNLAQVKAFASADYATAAQGTTADAALAKTGGAMTGAITTNSTFDGRDVATDGSKLDTITVSDITANTAKLTANTTNVTASGALMDSEVTNLAQVKAFSSADYATSTQGATADSALQSGDNISVLTNNSGYLTAESDTLDSVTGRGATTTNGVTVGSIDINGEIIEKAVNTTSVTGSTALDPANGTIQRLTFSGAVTFTDSLVDGESITLHIDDGSAHAATWPTTEWVGGSAPTLDTTNETIVVVWKVNSTLYGMSSGVAS